MPSILDDIVAQKREELARQKEQAPLAALEGRIASWPPALDFSSALRGQGVQLIAEVKKASPSRGLLCPDFDQVRLAGIYARNGAAAISVLTDPRFQGELEHIAQIK
jgi:indole-3-glycerol phosphate synthase